MRRYHLLLCDFLLVTSRIVADNLTCIASYLETTEAVQVVNPRLQISLEDGN